MTRPRCDSWGEDGVHRQVSSAGRPRPGGAALDLRPGRARRPDLVRGPARVPAQRGAVRGPAAPGSAGDLGPARARGPRPRDLPALAGRGRPAPPPRLRLGPGDRAGGRPGGTGRLAGPVRAAGRGRGRGRPGAGLAGGRARPPPGRRPRHPAGGRARSPGPARGPARPPAGGGPGLHRDQRRAAAGGPRPTWSRSAGPPPPSARPWSPRPPTRPAGSRTCWPTWPPAGWPGRGKRGTGPWPSPLRSATATRPCRRRCWAGRTTRRPDPGCSRWPTAGRPSGPAGAPRPRRGAAGRVTTLPPPLGHGRPLGEPDGHLLTVHLLGQLEVRLDGVAVDGWPSGRGRSLLKYLVTHRDPWPRPATA